MFPAVAATVLTVASLAAAFALSDYLVRRRSAVLKLAGAVLGAHAILSALGSLVSLANAVL